MTIAMALNTLKTNLITKIYCHHAHQSGGMEAITTDQVAFSFNGLFSSSSLINSNCLLCSFLLYLREISLAEPGLLGAKFIVIGHRKKA